MEHSGFSISRGTSTGRALGLLTLLAVLSAGCNSQDQTAMNTYDWTPTNTAPANYPVYLYRGYFMGADSSIISTPDRRTLYYGWQNDGAGYISGPTLKPVPRQVDLLWLSYAENTYYRAQIELPFDTITTLFEEGYIDAATREQDTYSTISYGIAPGGFVAVWVIGAGHWVEVATGKGQVITMAFEDMIPSTNLTQAEFTDLVLTDEVEDSVLAEIKQAKIPYERWPITYRTKYRLAPAMTHQAEEFTPLTVEMNFYNGEQEVRFYDRPEVKNNPKKAIPYYFRLEWRDARDNLFAARVYFDETEIFEAFRQLAPEAGGQELQLVARIARYNDEVTLKLAAGDTTIALPKTRVKIYAKEEDE